ncbi:MAG: hypothetical protein CMJ78_00415 [Planctomycetaceae bacterium]|nr:hypothetical protein [Planctomycetaceae bacterium]
MDFDGVGDLQCAMGTCDRTGWVIEGVDLVIKPDDCTQCGEDCFANGHTEATILDPDDGTWYVDPSLGTVPNTKYNMDGTPKLNEMCIRAHWKRVDREEWDFGFCTQFVQRC